MKSEERIVEQLFDYEIEAQESHEMAMNSYGARYDAGYVAALRWILSDEDD